VRKNWDRMYDEYGGCYDEENVRMIMILMTEYDEYSESIFMI
jgi:hypothetical protein